MEFLSDETAHGVRERFFALGEVTGVLWTDAEATGTRPLLLFGHAERQNKSKPDVVAFSRDWVAATGHTVAVIDAPCHGGRHRDATHLALIDEMERRAAAGVRPGTVADRFHAHIAPQGTLEWHGALDALQELEEVDADAPVGFFGVALGSLIGIPFVAEEPRVTAAVFGHAGLGTLGAAAARVSVPTIFRMQWDDEFVPREDALALYDALGSRRKALHANAGGHADVPEAEVEAARAFFVRHLEPATGAARTSTRGG